MDTWTLSLFALLLAAVLSGGLFWDHTQFSLLRYAGKNRSQAVHKLLLLIAAVSLIFVLAQVATSQIDAEFGRAPYLQLALFVLAIAIAIATGFWGSQASGAPAPDASGEKR
jgi:hypothetical protein